MNVYLYKRMNDGQLFQLWYERGCRSWYGNECRDPMADRPAKKQRLRTCVLRQSGIKLIREWVRNGRLKLKIDDYDLELTKAAEFGYRREDVEHLFDVKRSECLGVLKNSEVVR